MLNKSFLEGFLTGCNYSSLYVYNGNNAIILVLEA